MCGIVGIVGTSPVNQRLYDALTVLQHRGQDAAGIATAAGWRALRPQGQRPGARCVPAAPHAGVARRHGYRPCALSDRGRDSATEAQPFYVNAPYGICLAHNGNLTNATRTGARCCPRGSPAPEHDLGFGGAPECICLGAAARRDPAGHAGRHLRGSECRLPALPRRLCGRRHGDRPRHPRLPRPQRHPAAGAGPARDGQGSGVDAGLGKRRARHALVSAGARHRPR